MATKKAGSTAKKSTRAKSQPAKAVKSTVTTVRAVETAKAESTTSRFGGDRTSLRASALIGEFIGTFLLAGAYLVTKGEPLYMGFVLITVILMVGTLSGAYLNPALTVGAWVTRKIGHLRAVGYIVAQLLGAGAAFVVLSAFVNAAAGDASSAYSSQAAVFKMAVLSDKSHWFAIGAELLGTAVLAFAFAGALREKTDRVAKALTVGFGLFVAALTTGVALSYLGANVALNPAVALSATAVDWTKIDWLAAVAYFIVPLLGAIVGFALRDVVEQK